MEEKKVNGLRTAVKYGQMTAKEALEILETRSRLNGYTSQNLINWLRRQCTR